MFVPTILCACVLLLLLLQTLTAYVQWVMLIINLPISWMPWATSSGATTAAASRSFSDFVSWFLGIVFGRSASLDCFLQAHDILQAGHQRDIILNVFARAIGRWVGAQSGTEAHSCDCTVAVFSSAGYQAGAGCLAAGLVLCATHLKAHEAPVKVAPY
jgi:hypothetical protein